MKASVSQVLIYTITITITNLAWPGLFTVNGNGFAVTEVFVPIRVCHKAIFLTGVELDDDLADEIINSLTSLDQPFELDPNHLNYLKSKLFNQVNLIVRFTCLAHIVLVRDGHWLRRLKMNLVLKRFNRKRGNDNDFVLVFAPLADQLHDIDWRHGYSKYLMPRNFPDNALLIQLDECAGCEYGLRRYCISDVYTFQLYCNEEQDVCWRSQSAVGSLFPKSKADFDAKFTRVRAYWRYNYNHWHILFEDNLLRGDFDGVASMSFGRVATGRYTWEDYNSEDDYPLYAPTVWLTFEIARHLNATLLPRSWFNAFEHGAEIWMRVMLPIDRLLAIRPESRNVHLQYGHIKFAYCTNSTSLRN